MWLLLLCNWGGFLGCQQGSAQSGRVRLTPLPPLYFQAQARCHRIGQSKAVKIYRLITRNSYEREMFDKASLKLGLDKAVLQSMSGKENAANGV